MAGIVVIGDRAGRIWQRTAPGTWALVYNSERGRGNASIHPLRANYPSSTALWAYGAGVGGGSDQLLTSSDDGATWGAGTPAAGLIESRLTGTPQSDAGAMYFRGNSSAATGVGIYRSTDGGVTATEINGDTPDGLAVCNGYLWWLPSARDGSLHRCDLDGSNPTSFALGLSGSGTLDNLVAIPGCNHLYAWNGYTTALCTIDVSNPAAPTASNVSDPFSGPSIITITPVSGTVAVAQAYNGSQQGSIWRSTDAGLTWTEVASASSNIANSSSNDRSYCAAVDLNDPNNVYILGAVRNDLAEGAITAWCLVSDDGGLTWSEEQVVGSLDNAGSPYTTTWAHWESIAVSGAPTCQPVLLLGTDNGQIARRVGSSDSIAFTSSLSGGTGSDIILAPIVTPADFRDVWALSWGNFYAARSADAGASWTEDAPISDGHFIQKPYWKLSDGTLIRFNLVSAVDPGPWKLQTSTDYGQSWTDLSSTNTPPKPRAYWVGGGYIWWMERAVGANTLHRLDLDGTNEQTFGFTGGSFSSDANLVGYGTSKRLYAWSQGNYDLVTIDITDPDAPTFATVTGPFDTGSASARGIYWITPITNLVALAYAIDDGVTVGGVYRTTDGGTTWTAVIAATAQLNYTGTDTDGDQMIALSPSNPQHCYVATVIPYIYESTDGGATWASADYTGASLGDAVAWTGVAVANTCAGGGGDDEPTTPTRRAFTWASVIGCISAMLGGLAAVMRACGVGG